MELLERARQWASHDPDPATASALSADIEAAERGDEEAVARVGAAMNGPLQFGTAGLRGVVGPGESRMNLAVVIRATAGLCEVVKRHATGTPTLVVGCDARYGSSEFAMAACRVASSAGVRVLALPQANPTPLTSFAVRHYGADAGVMVTASHNPAPDNGYKVYLGGSVVTGDGQGVQIVPPFDAEIAAAIEAAPPADEIPMNDDLVEAVDPREEYVACASALASGEASVREDLRIVLTAMHGVGAAITSRVLAEAGFSNVSLVAAQADPDPDFPTVPFPNPEEAGALDMAIEQAREQGADLIIAVDPDADRCALAVPDPASETGWSPLSGDQIGCSRASPAPTAWSITRRSRASSGSPAPPGLGSATRRPSVFAPTPPTCATRTASRRRSSPPPWWPPSRHRDAACGTSSSAWRDCTACT